MSGGIARGRLAEVSTQLAFLGLYDMPKLSSDQPLAMPRFELPCDKNFGRGRGFCAEPAAASCVLMPFGLSRHHVIFEIGWH